MASRSANDVPQMTLIMGGALSDIASLGQTACGDIPWDMACGTSARGLSVCRRRTTDGIPRHQDATVV
jgi:hypothetical protein